MNQFLNIEDVSNLNTTVQDAIALKNNPFLYHSLGKQKTLVLLFFNASLRTRISTELAAKNLGMNVIVLNLSDAWQLEFEDGVVMNLDTSEHIKEAAQVISQYTSIIAKVNEVRKIIKEIDTLIAIYLGKVDKRQGITRNKEVTVNQRFGNASYYVRSRFGKQTATEIQLINQFKEEFNKALSKTNSFFNKEWISYKSSTEKIYISPFKETKIYSIK